MSASYPGSAKTFISRNAGDVIQPAHVNDLQDEVNAIETALLGTLAHNVTISGLLSVTAGVTGSQLLTVRNTSAGTGNTARINLGNDASANLLDMVSYSSTYTSVSGYDAANGTVLFQAGAGGLSLNANAGSLRFYTGTERMRIHASGGVSIGSAVDPNIGVLRISNGTTSGTIQGADSAYRQLTADGLYVSIANSGVENHRFHASGGVSIGSTTDPAATGVISSLGFLMATWGTTASAANANVANGAAVKLSTSLRANKHSIETIPVADAVQAVQYLRPVLYRSAIDEDQRLWPGFIAEEVEQAAPHLAMYATDGKLQSVAYDRVCAYLCAVIQDLSARVQALEAAR
jgi:hypothetical protein